MCCPLLSIWFLLIIILHLNLSRPFLLPLIQLLNIHHYGILGIFWCTQSSNRRSNYVLCIFCKYINFNIILDSTQNVSFLASALPHVGRVNYDQPKHIKLPNEHFRQFCLSFVIGQACKCSKETFYKLYKVFNEQIL